VHTLTAYSCIKNFLQNKNELRDDLSMLAYIFSYHGFLF